MAQKPREEASRLTQDYGLSGLGDSFLLIPPVQGRISWVATWSGVQRRLSKGVGAGLGPQGSRLVDLDVQGPVLGVQRAARTRGEGPCEVWVRSAAASSLNSNATVVSAALRKVEPWSQVAQAPFSGRLPMTVLALILPWIGRRVSVLQQRGRSVGGHMPMAKGLQRDT